VLIDLDMPAMRGDRLVQVLRGRHRFTEAKLILMSGHDEDELLGIAADVGADAVVAKADGARAIVAAVIRFLGAPTR
jgi:CheY-like chemotaxis protein